MTTASADVARAGPAAALRAALGPAARGLVCGIVWLAETESTNDRLLSLPPAASHGWVVFAGSQTHGRGRNGLPWWSAAGAGIYLSLGWTFPGRPAAALGPLSLRLGLAVAESLAPFAPGKIRLKWPNDLLVEEAKLGGMLVETRSCGQGVAVVVGVGVNLTAVPPAGFAAGEPATSLAAISPGPLPSHEEVVAMLVEALVPALAAWDPAAERQWLERWRAMDALADTPVRWTEAGHVHEGLARGPADDGRLRVMTAQGERRVTAGAMRRLRPVPSTPAA